MPPRERIIVALDVDSLDRASRLVESLAPHVGCFKLGLELLTAAGTPQAVERIHRLGGRVFLDAKFCDIPNTVAKASAEAARLRVRMFDVHASCGIEALKAAAANKGEAILLAVTVLTSMDDEHSRHVFGEPAATKVKQFALDAVVAGADGIVCSPRELEMLSGTVGLKSLIKVTPGVRPKWAATDDQSRITTPAEAVRLGATYLVIGRPILQPPSSVGTPVDAVKRIQEEIAGAGG